MEDESWVKENKKDEKKKGYIECWILIWFYGADVDIIEIDELGMASEY